MALVDASWTQSNVDVDRMGEHAREASEFLKALAHEGRLMILCDLLRGEKSVGELEALLSRRQSTVSQQLARLRLEGLNAPRRPDGLLQHRQRPGAVDHRRALCLVLRSGRPVAARKDEARFVAVNHARRKCYRSGPFFPAKGLQAKPNKTKQNSLDLLGFIRPNRDFSMGYGDSK
jgi:ArsR family transcriptional regulator